VSVSVGWALELSLSIGCRLCATQIRKAMVSHPRSAEVQKHAAMALWKIAHLSPKQQETIALEGCVDLLIDNSTNEHAFNESVMTAVTGALLATALGNPTTQVCSRPFGIAVEPRWRQVEGPSGTLQWSLCRPKGAAGSSNFKLRVRLEEAAAANARFAQLRLEHRTR